MTDPPADESSRLGPASRKWEKFRAEDAESTEAKHLVPALGEVLGTLLGVGLPRFGRPAKEVRWPLGVWLVLFALLGVSAVMLLWDQRNGPRPAAVQNESAEARADVERLVTGDEDAFRRVASRHRGLAIPALLDVLGTRDVAARRRAAQALRQVAETHGGALTKANAASLATITSTDPDPQVRIDLAAAGAKLSTFWR